MDAIIEIGVVALLLMNLAVLGSSRLIACIRIIAAQGVLLALMPLLFQADHLTWRLSAQAAASMALKGIIFPWLLARAVREVDARREVEPFVGYAMSLVLGVGMLGAAFYLGAKLPAPERSTLVVPLALFTIMVGLFLIVSRRSAVNQVLGYLAMENGIYAFGMSLAEREPMLVEMGILLDAFVAVFVMGIAIYHISREFDHLDTDRLSSLKD